MIENQQKSIDFVWPAQKTIRADTIQNRHFFRTLLKFALFFFIICYSSKLLPDAYRISTYTPKKWEQLDILQVHDVSSLNRYLKVYAAPANVSQNMDLVHEVEVYSLVDNEQKQRRMSVSIADMSDYVDISDNQLKFYFGDLHILEDVAYRVKLRKPLKVGRLLQEKPANQPVNQQHSNIDPTAQQNSTISGIENNKTEQQLQEEKKKQEQQKRKQEEEQKRKQQEQEQRRKQQQAKQKQRRIEEQIRKKQQEQRQKLYDHTNIRIQVQQMSSFSTILELFIRYVSMLMIIYVATDNRDAPRSIPIICVITSNPLLFLQISYPNQVSDAIDCLCRSGPLLYFPVWLYYIHTKIKFPEQTRQKIWLFIKIGLGLSLYIVNTLRLLHFHVLTLETLIGIGLILFVGLYLWEAFLDLQHQHHRDKVLVVVTLAYIVCLFTFKILTGPYKDIMFYIIHQTYGLYIIYLMASPKTIKKHQKIPTTTDLHPVQSSNQAVVKQK